MQVTDKVFEVLRLDYSLRKKIADLLQLREGTISSWVYRKQHAKVGFYTVVNIIKEHTGLVDEDIFLELQTQKN